MKRRDVVLATPALLAGAAGCSTLSPSPGTLSVAVFNHADDHFAVRIEILRRDVDDRSNARVYSRLLEVDPDESVVQEDVADVRPYVVRYTAYRNNSHTTAESHVHFYPEDSSDDTVAFDVDSDGTVTRR